MRDYQSMSLEDLLLHHQTIGETILQKTGLEVRLAKPRRTYPVVSPKFQNPKSPFQTWTGRGRQPRWVRELLATGGRLEDLKII